MWAIIVLNVYKKRNNDDDGNNNDKKKQWKSAESNARLVRNSHIVEVLPVYL